MGGWAIARRLANEDAEVLTVDRRDVDLREQEMTIHVGAPAHQSISLIRSGVASVHRIAEIGGQRMKLKANQFGGERTA